MTTSSSLFIHFGNSSNNLGTSYWNNSDESPYVISFDHKSNFTPRVFVDPEGSTPLWDGRTEQYGFTTHNPTPQISSNITNSTNNGGVATNDHRSSGLEGLGLDAFNLELDLKSDGLLETDWLTRWTHSFTSPSQQLHRLPDPIFIDPPGTISSGRFQGWGSSVQSYNSYISSTTPTSGDSPILESLHRVLEVIDHLTWVQFTVDAPNMTGFANCMLEEVREECKRVGIGIGMIQDDLADDNKKWWDSIPSSISLAQAILKYEEQGALVTPLSISSAWTFLSSSHPSLLESTISFNQKRKISLSLLSQFAHYPALLPLYSTSKDDRPIVHLSGSYISNNGNGNEFKFFENKRVSEFRHKNRENSHKVNMKWDEVVWDFSVPNELKCTLNETNHLFESSVILKSHHENDTRSNFVDPRKVESWLEERFNHPFTFQTTSIPSSRSSRQSVLTAYTSSSNSTILLSPPLSSLQQILSPMTNFSAIWNTLDLGFEDDVRNDLEARDELVAMREGVWRLLEGYGGIGGDSDGGDDVNFED